jgi:hypothetical protein
MKNIASLLLSVGLLFKIHAMAEENNRLPQPLTPLGGAKFENWSGLDLTANGAMLETPGEAMFRYPHGEKGWYVFGFRTRNDGTRDWRDFYGVQFDVQVTEGRACELTVTISTPDATPRQEYLKTTNAVTTLNGGAGWQRVTIPWTVFDFNKRQSAFLEFVQELRLAAKFTDGKAGGDMRLKNIRLVRAPLIALDTPAHGKAAQAGETARYDVTLSNCTDAPQTVNLAFEKGGFEAMTTSVEPATLEIAAGATSTCAVSVSVPRDGVPAGGHESQKLVAISNGDGATLAKLELVTARDVARPSILHTPQGWDEVREKVAHYDWAKKSQNDFVKAADAWQVPEASTPEQRAHGPEGHVYVFLNKEFETLGKVAIAYQLTRDKKYAEKVALFLRRLSDEKNGYPSTFAGTSMGSPQEGGNFQGIAIAYDAILGAGVLSDDDKRAIDHTLRLFMETYETDLNVGNMGN